MNLADVLKAVDAVSVRRVFGEPYEKDGLTVIPAAVVHGGGGGGSGHAENQDGEGGGYGLGGRPVGAYVIRGDEVRWLPAVDPNRILAMIGVVLVVHLLTRPRVARARVRATCLRPSP